MRSMPTWRADLKLRVMRDSVLGVLSTAGDVLVVGGKPVIRGRRATRIWVGLQLSMASRTAVSSGWLTGPIRKGGENAAVAPIFGDVTIRELECGNTMPTPAVRNQCRRYSTPCGSGVDGGSRTDA